MKKNFFEKFILIFLIFSLILPEIILAENFEGISLEEINKYLQLSERDAKNLLNSLVQNFKNQWIDIESSPDFVPEEGLVLLLLEKAIKRDILTYFLIDVPFEVTEKIIKYAIKIGQIFISQDLATIFNEIERESVKRAVDYGTKKLLENEIRITPGTLTLQYLSFSGQKEVVFQYLVIYKPIDSKHGKVEIRFYSPTSIEPPKSIWAFPHEVSGNLPPFIVEVSGSLEKFKWVEKPMVKISFPESVPDLGISPLSFWDKHIIEPIRNDSNETKIVINKFFRKSKQNAEKIKNWFENTLAEIRDKALHLAAQVISFTQFRKKEDITKSEIETTKSELGKLKEEISYLKEKLEIEESLRKELKEKYESESNEVLKQVDDFTARLDTFSQQLNEFNKIQPKKSPEESAKLKSEEEAETETETVTFCQRKDGDLPKRNKIVFNEIAWMGTETSSSDEWMELENISGTGVDLADWQILDKDGQIQIIFSSGELFSANGFYLLERTDDNSVPNVSANKIYTGALNDTNEAIYLFNKNCEFQDEILANPNWPAGDKNSKRTMERKNDLSWQTSSNIGGTPKSQNSSGYFFAGGGGGGGGGTGGGSGGGSSGGGGGTASIPTYCSQENLTTAVHQPIIINEIAWMGTSSTNWRNEWIELKNISTNPISLVGWQLLDKDGDIKIIFESSDSIATGSLYLLEWKDDETVPNVLADKTYSGNLRDEDESLRLFDQNCNLIDEVLANPDWPAGNKDERRSMERDSNLNWHNYFGSGANGIFGTPKAENSQPAQPILKVAPESLEFSATQFGQNPQSQTLNIENIGSGNLEWIAVVEYVSPPVEGINWLSLDSNSGTTATVPSEVSVSVDISGLESGNYSAILKIEAQGAQNSPQEISVTLNLAPAEFLSPVDHLIISEVQLADNEFVELYNPTDENINMCPDEENCWYFSYFSSRKDWNEPYRNWQFPERTNIAASTHYLIGIFNYPDVDWEILTQEGKPYSTGQINNNAGSVAIFSCDPKDTEENPKTVEEAMTCKVDALGWGETVVKEGEPADPIAPAEKSLARKIGITQDGFLVYKDSDNNQADFEIQEPTPRAINKHSYSDLDGDLIIDPFDPETIVTEEITLNVGEYNFRNLIIEENGKLILNSDSSAPGFKGVKIITENLFIDATSSISADGRGYPAGQGPGKGEENGSGGGYGGKGGDLGNFLGGKPYGSLFQPNDLGSGGGNIGNRLGGAGGGAIILEISDTLTINGIVSANGENGQWRIIYIAPATGAGSGGSIYIRTNVLEGSGKILANGGNTDSAGAGGGGRIAIYYNSMDEFTGEIDAFGGDCAYCGFTSKGGAGTIFLKQNDKTYGDLIIDNNKLSGGSTYLTESEYHFDNLKVLNSAHFYLPEKLAVNNLEINDAILEATTTTTIEANQIIITENSSLIGPAQTFLLINVENDFLLQSESKLIGNFEIEAKNLDVATSSSILADGKGYPAEKGPGCLPGDVAGGSYGGIGIRNTTSSIYGNEEEPQEFGSGGGGYGQYPAGAGGGAIIIETDNTLTIDGIISANGSDGHYHIPGNDSDPIPSTGSGSGGSVYIKTTILTGKGKITANGGGGDYAGAGGRIAIYSQTNNFQGIIQVEGGAAGYQAGQDGTIYLNE